MKRCYRKGLAPTWLGKYYVRLWKCLEHRIVSLQNQ